MTVKFVIVIPPHIAKNGNRLKAIVDRVVPSPLPADFSVTCSYPQAIALQYSVDYTTAAAAYLGVRQVLNLGAPV